MPEVSEAAVTEAEVVSRNKTQKGGDDSNQSSSESRVKKDIVPGYNVHISDLYLIVHGKQPMKRKFPNPIFYVMSNKHTREEETLKKILNEPVEYENNIIKITEALQKWAIKELYKLEKEKVKDDIINNPKTLSWAIPVIQSIDPDFKLPEREKPPPKNQIGVIPKGKVLSDYEVLISDLKAVVMNNKELLQGAPFVLTNENPEDVATKLSNELKTTVSYDSDKKINITPELIKWANDILDQKKPKIPEKTSSENNDSVTIISKEPENIEINKKLGLIRDNEMVISNSQLTPNSQLIPNSPLIPNNTPIPTKLYNIVKIESTNPWQDNFQMGYYYRDFYPSILSSNYFINLDERETLKLYLKSTLFNKSNQTLADLFSRVVTTKINPLAGPSKITKSPYDLLPEGLLIYQTRYPITIDSSNASPIIIPSKDSKYFNLRIYQLANDFQNSDEEQIEAIREIRFYDYIYRYIIQEKINQNFIMMYDYKITKDINIKFPRKIKPETNTRLLNIEQIIATIKNLGDDSYNELLKFVNYVYQVSREISIEKTFEKLNISYNDLNPAIKSRNSEFYNVNTPEKNQVISHFYQVIMKNVFKQIPLSYLSLVPSYQYNNGNIIYALTEEADKNIFKWASNVYSIGETVMNVQEMKSSGIHKIEEWDSVFIQIIACCITLIKNYVYIPTLSLFDNFFIKSVTNEKSYKYVFDNIPHWIKADYLVLFDTTFKSAENEDHKIYFGNSDKYQYPRQEDNTFWKKFTTSYINLFDPDSSFNSEFFKTNGGCYPGDKVIKIMDQIFKYLKKNVDSIIQKQNENEIIQDFIQIFKNAANMYLCHGLNNRIGTYYMEDERRNQPIIPYRSNNTTTPQRNNLNINMVNINPEMTESGDICFYQKNFNTPLIITMIFDTYDNNQSIIYVRTENGDITLQLVDNNNIFMLESINGDNIKQNMDNIPRDYDSVLATFNY